MNSVLKKALLAAFLIGQAYITNGQTPTTSADLDGTHLQIAFECFEAMPIQPYGRISGHRDRFFRKRYSGDCELQQDSLWGWAREFSENQLRELYERGVSFADVTTELNPVTTWLKMSQDERALRCRFTEALAPEHFPIVHTPAIADDLLRALRTTANHCLEFRNAFARILLAGGARLASDELISALLNHLEHECSLDCRSELLDITVASPDDEFRSKFNSSICESGETPLARMVLDKLFSDEWTRRCGLGEGQLVQLIQCMPDTDVVHLTRKWSGAIYQDQQLMHMVFTKGLPDEKREALACEFVSNRQLARRALASKDSVLLTDILEAALRPGQRAIPRDFDLEDLLDAEPSSEAHKQLVVATIGRRAMFEGRRVGDAVGTHTWRAKLEALTGSGDAIVSASARQQLKRLDERIARDERERIERIRGAEAHFKKRANQLRASLAHCRQSLESSPSRSGREAISTISSYIWMAETELIKAAVQRMHLEYLESKKKITWAEYLRQEQGQLREHECKVFMLDPDANIELEHVGSLLGIAACDSSIEGFYRKQNWREFELDFLCLLSIDGKSLSIDYHSFKVWWDEAMTKREEHGSARIELEAEIEGKMRNATPLGTN